MNLQNLIGEFYKRKVMALSKFCLTLYPAKFWSFPQLECISLWKLFSDFSFSLLFFALIVTNVLDVLEMYSII